MQEIWKQVTIEPYCDYYSVSNFGNVKSTCRYLNNGAWTLEDRPIKQYTDNRGYKYVIFSVLGKKKYVKVHRLVATAFVPNPRHFKQVNHIDGNKLNNSLSNLEWCTLEYNVSHAHKTGLISKQSRPIYQFDIDGNFIQVWESAKSIENALGINEDFIYHCCNKVGMSAHTFLWSYDSQYPKYKNIKRKKVLNGIDQYDLDGNFISHYNTIKEVEVKFGRKLSNISTCCSGKRSNAYGYIWKYSL